MQRGKFCSNDEKSCSNLIRWEKLMKLYVKKEKDRTKYNDFIQNIKECKIRKSIEIINPDN